MWSSTPRSATGLLMSRPRRFRAWLPCMGRNTGDIDPNSGQRCPADPLAHGARPP